MLINAANSAVQNLVDQIIADNNGLALTPAKVTFGVPSVFAGANGRNTQVVITAVANAGFSGTKTVDYTRLGVFTGTANAAALASAGVVVDPAATAAEVKAQLVALFGLVADQVEVADLVLPVNETTPGSITLAAVDGSLLYVGNDSVVLTVADADVPLETAVTNDQLTGFTPAQ